MPCRPTRSPDAGRDARSPSTLSRFGSLIRQEGTRHNLNTYKATTHFNGQSTISIDGDRASGESYCLAHHISVDDEGGRTLMVASIRYYDQFVRQADGWRFAERRLLVDWTETRPSQP